MGDPRRNLDAHKAAKAALWMFSGDYANQKGGVMDFWDALSASRKELCREAVQSILAAREEEPPSEESGRA